MTTTPTPDNPHTDLLARADVDQLVALLGHLPDHRDARLDLPLPRQVRLLLDLATAHRPDFRRTVPASPTDHDILICEVLVKLIGAVDEAVADRDRLAARVQVREEAIADVLAEIDMSAASGYPCEFGQVQVDALRALVAPDTPTSPTDTGDPA